LLWRPAPRQTGGIDTQLFTEQVRQYLLNHQRVCGGSMKVIARIDNSLVIALPLTLQVPCCCRIITNIRKLRILNQ
jgi:hypothetical protein